MSFAPFNSSPLLPQEIPQRQQIPQIPQQQRYQQKPSQPPQKYIDVSKPIIFYSRYCKHSGVFLEGLQRHPVLDKNFIKISIDVDNQTKQRPKVFYDIQMQLKHRIKSVPTIIVEEGQYVLTDKEAFKWLEFNLKKDKEMIQGFSSKEMNEFSDHYADFGSTPIEMMDENHVREQRFKFLNKKDETIMTPAEGDSRYERNEKGIKHERGQMDDLLTQQQRRMGKLDFTDNVKESKMNANLRYQSESLPPMQKTAIDFTHPNLGYAGKVGGPQNKSGHVFQQERQSEMESRFEQLKMERESIGVNHLSPNVKVDFQTGQIIQE